MNQNTDQNTKKLNEIREAATAKSGGRICRPGSNVAAPAAANSDDRIRRPGSEVAPAPAPAAPALPTNDNRRSGGFRMMATPAEPPQSSIVGQLLKFKNPDFVTNRGVTVVPIGTQLIARDVSEAWVRFEGGTLAEPPIIRRPDRSFPGRQELGHLDPAKWPPGLDGKPADPWSRQFYLLLFDPLTLDDYTFVTSSFGGQKAVRELCRRVDHRREVSGIFDALARVELAVTRWSSKKYGVIISPDFTIKGWVGSDLRPLPDIKLADEIDDAVVF